MNSYILSHIIKHISPSRVAGHDFFIEWIIRCFDHLFSLLTLFLIAFLLCLIQCFYGVAIHEPSQKLPPKYKITKANTPHSNVAKLTMTTSPIYSQKVCPSCQPMSSLKRNMLYKFIINILIYQPRDTKHYTTKILVYVTF